MTLSFIFILYRPSGVTEAEGSPAEATEIITDCLKMRGERKTCGV